MRGLLPKRLGNPPMKSFLLWDEPHPPLVWHTDLYLRLRSFLSYLLAWYSSLLRAKLRGSSVLPTYDLRMGSLCLYSAVCYINMQLSDSIPSALSWFSLFNLLLPAATVSGCWIAPHATLCKEVLPSIASLTLGDKSSSSLCMVPTRLPYPIKIFANTWHSQLAWETNCFRRTTLWVTILFFLAEDIHLDFNVYIEM